jgi:hypothetical protein
VKAGRGDGGVGKTEGFFCLFACLFGGTRV